MVNRLRTGPRGVAPSAARLELKRLQLEEKQIEADLIEVRAQRAALEKEKMAQFSNVSGVELSPELKLRLIRALDELKARALRDGLTKDEASSKVAVLFMPDEGDDLATLVPKPELRSFLAEYEQYSNMKERLVEEKLIVRCLEDLPHGALRVLFISRELCGTLQVHTSHVLDIKAPGEEAERATLERAFTEETGKPTRSWPFMVGAAPGYSGDETVADVTNKLMDTLKGYPKKVAREILEKVHNEDLVLKDMRDKILADEKAQEEDLARFDALVPEFKGKWDVVMRRALKVPIPPSSTSAVNVEALMMAAAYVFEPLNYFEQFGEHSNNPRVIKTIVDFIGIFSYKSPAVRKLLERTSGVLKGKPYSSHIQDFGVMWMHAGFPKLEIGHKLAASLCMTDVPDDIEVLAPWKAWSLIVPPGLFNEQPGEETYARIWCVGAEPRFFIMSTGEIVGPFTRATFFEAHKGGDSDVHAIMHALDSLIRGACLSLSNPDDYKRTPLKEKAAGVKKPQRDGDPDFTASRFMLSAPVMVDARPHLLDYINGKKHKGGGGAPKVQFFVRGHWRNQAHGPRMSLRKQMRIEGYWKGPEHGNVLLRNYKVKEDGDDIRTKAADDGVHPGTGDVQGDAVPLPSR